MRKEAPTGRDVAALAGVSPMTVSRVVNGEGNVNPDLRKRVIEAVEKLGYEPDYNAAATRNPKRARGAVGLCVEAIQNPFSSGVAEGLEQALRPHAMMMFMGSSEGDPEVEQELLLEFYRRRVSALVVITVCSDHSFLLPRAFTSTPVIYVDRPALLPGCDTVTSNHQRGAHEATSHLLAQGHSRIGFIGTNLSGHPIHERYSGYVEALRSAGHDEDSGLVLSFGHSRTTDDIRDRTRSLLQSKNAPTALFSASNSELMGMRLALRDLGLVNSVAHVTFDDLEYADLMDPPVSAFAQDPVGLGRRAGEAVIQRLATSERSPSRTFVVDGALKIRGSSGKLADPLSASGK